MSGPSAHQARPPTQATQAAQAAQAAQAEGSREPSNPNWADEPERSNAMALRVMGWIAVVCGRRLARVVLAGIALYFVVFAARQRRASRRYLARALGREAGWRDGYRHVFAFAATVLDRVYFLRERTAWLDLRVRGAEHVDACLASGRGAFLMGSHIGSFEALRVTGRDRPELDITMLMYPDNARKINAALQALAPGASPRIIALGRPEAMLAVRERLEAGGLVGVLADRTLPGAESQRGGVVWLPFLGRPAPFSDGPFRLAELLRQRVVFMVGLYAGGRTYDVRFEPLADFSERLRDPAARAARLQAAMQAYVAQLESLCREHPDNWFNFHDFWHEDAA
ncbi:LpxL/LpxP family acyltransferase [Aquabacterium sp. OR-4]|uniref:LpxL/LpxP family acyltransferase n=1 Tax=Aquabacterium sp. OR-4 TaxID=2978127 RepID=UPI0021B4ACFC|nr:acyl-CoA synthetase [Aquabacterium sp. OR-4]MDT7836741.1 acyl-CoA synthetase [Aquabacterium sp. OR-4]